jgi:hypothetical protein
MGSTSTREIERAIRQRRREANAEMNAFIRGQKPPQPRDEDGRFGHGMDGGSRGGESTVTDRPDFLRDLYRKARGET